MSSQSSKSAQTPGKANAESIDDKTDDKTDDRTNEPMMPLWEVFVRPRTGLNHKHVGSLHAADEELALNAARDVYTRREEGNSIWVVRSQDIFASDPDRAAENFDPAADKVYRHPSFYDIPDDIGHM